MKIAAVIVTYNPEIKCLQDNINAIVKQVEVIYIIDNDSKNLTDIKSITEKEEKCQLIKLSKNEGIARALNIACEKAYNATFEWIITLDQDSICPENIIEEYKKYIKLEKCAMLSSCIFDRSRNLITTDKKKEYSQVDSCITSGSLLNLNVWKELNGFDEYLFIDGVDFDICYRIIKADYKIYRINSVVLNHEIGKSEYKKIFNWRVVVMHHPPFRKYYIARNNIYLSKKGLWKLYRGLLKNAKILLITILYEDKKINKSKKILKGTIDGLKNRELVK